MSIVEQIHSIAKKLGVTVTGETISELMVSLDKEIDKKFVNVTDTTPQAKQFPVYYPKKPDNKNNTPFSSKKNKKRYEPASDNEG